MNERSFGSTAFLTIAALALGGCGEESGGGPGTGSSVTLTAPGIVSPNSSSPVADTQPTLTVTNATASNGATPTYTFQVASDQAFGSMVAQASGIAQGSGQTSWEVSHPLASGSYFWRARAEAAGVAGQFSAVAQLAVLGIGGPGESIVVSDDLMHGSTVAIARGGGTFTSGGWRVDSNNDFLRYEVPTVAHGYVQWQNVGLTPQGIADSRMFFGMWDPTAGNFRTNPFRVNVQHAWPPDHNPPWIRLRWISQGRQEDGGYNFNNWDPGAVYTWRVEWGPDGEDELARVLLDGVEVIRLPYNYQYQPNVHWIELGIEERRESIINLVYRNFAVVRR